MRHQNRPGYAPQRQRDGDKVIGGECGWGGLLFGAAVSALFPLFKFVLNIKLFTNENKIGPRQRSEPSEVMRMSWLLEMLQLPRGGVLWKTIIQELLEFGAAGVNRRNKQGCGAQSQTITFDIHQVIKKSRKAQLLNVFGRGRVCGSSLSVLSTTSCV